MSIASVIDHGDISGDSLSNEDEERTQLALWDLLLDCDTFDVLSVINISAMYLRDIFFVLWRNLFLIFFDHYM